MVIEEVAQGVYRVPIPVPIPLRYVNCYLLRGRDGWALIDTGMHDPAAEAAWHHTFETLKISFSEITTILVTHYHPDHYGMAGWLQERTGAPVLMGEIERAAVQRIWHGDHRELAINEQFFIRYGLPSAEVAALRALSLHTVTQVVPHPSLTTLDASQPLQLGDRTWEVQILPGHSDGQVCLYDRADQLMLIADHVLPTITPNISLWPESRPDPLEAYLETLPRLRAMAVRLALPGHKHPFTNWVQRIDEISEHHDQRLGLIEHAAQTSRTAWEICCTIFPVEALSPHQLRFAMAETLAHVVLLERQGRIERQERQGIVFFVAH